MADVINIKDLIMKNRFYKESLSSYDAEDMVFIESSKDIVGKDFNEILRSATDYAIMNSVAINKQNRDQFGRVGTATYWLRSQSPAALKAQSVYVNNGALKSLDYFDVNTKFLGLCPLINLDLAKMEQVLKCNPEFGNIKVAKNDKGKEVCHTIEFGNYPKTKVDEDLAGILEKEFINGNLTKTGKVYTGCQKTDVPKEFNKNTEYEYNNEKYVRVKAECLLNGNYANGDSTIPNKIEWVKVEPITWEIKNWNELPKSINPDGNNTATNLQLKSQQVMLGGIPFYPQVSKDNICNAWKDSLVRGFLNSINSCTYNSKNLALLMDTRFENRGFLNDAFDEEVTYDKNYSSSKEKVKHSYGIEVVDEPMSVEEQIKFYIENGKSFMLHGASGVGKTRRIEEADPDYVSIVLRNGILPEEVIGKTIFPNDDKKLGGIWSPPAWYVSLCEKCEKEPDKNHVLFIDEITNVKPSEQSLVFHLVLNNSIGPNVGQLPKNVVVVAAGNTKEESEAAYNMPEPLFRRFEGHIELKPEVQKFLEWGSEKSKKGEDRLKVHPIVAAFVGTYGDDVFYSPYDSEEPPKFAIDPRGWEQVSDIIYDNKGVIRRELIENKVGHQIASAFMAFAKNPPLTLYDVLNKNYTKEDIPTTFDAKYALALSLRRVTEQDISEVRQFIKNELGAEILSMFDSIWVGDDDERAIAISQCEDEFFAMGN